MKLHFDPNLDFQKQAIDAVCDLFRGQETCRTEFTVTHGPTDPQMRFAFARYDLGIGNRLALFEDEILKNLNDIQLRNGLMPSTSLASRDFTVEMETGTGKTYVYLRTIFELNKRYGFTKFVVVVPSVAIKEGVYKSLQIMEEHFRAIYTNIPFEYFLYDSPKLGQVRNFATSNQIQIMIVTVGAINKKDVNNLYKDSEKTGGEKPIDLIKATGPILIVDEPQSVDGGLAGRGKEALGAMNPLCTLRYSATHVDKHHMVFRLDAVDAYERELVKQIEVASASIEEAFNKPYVRLLTVGNKRGVITAKVEIDVQAGLTVRRQEKIVQDGDNLEQATSRAVYENCHIGEIRVEKGNEFMELRVPQARVYLRMGEAYGDVDALAIHREMIRRTIREHLDKEKRLGHQGIKVLSLFFIDVVEKYRKYDQDGNPVKGDYARIFEEEYERLARHPDYQTLFQEVDLRRAAEEVHNGYFSIDRKNIGGKTVEVLKDTRGDSKADDGTYSLIMRDKEKLLSFETPLKFIFSHSALREGWDNPNVFQICSLRDIRTEMERRQTIGRGLRLCVNQDGERLRGFETNTLTVIATEGYEQFAENLQKEIEEDTGIRFGIVEQHQFAAIGVLSADGTISPMGADQSKALWEYLRTKGYVDVKGKVQDSLREALRAGTLMVPETFATQLPQIKEVLHKLAGKLEINNADERRHVRTRQAELHSAEFKALWDRIKHKTIYRVQFDNEKLIKNCIDLLRQGPPIMKTRLQWRKADIAIGKAGIEATERAGAATVVLDEEDIQLPDLLTDLQDRTQLTRRTIAHILVESGRLNDFKSNPQQFIEVSGELINRTKRMAIVDGIKYQRLGDEYYYAQELFDQEELTGYLKNMLIDMRKSVLEDVICDSGTEANFAQQLENNEAVKVYAKLPGWFRVPTPLGSYNPDWAVLIEKDGTERLYFVVETKSSLFADDLRDRESAKIACGEAHFKALAIDNNPVEFKRATKLEDLLASS
ncbi:MAG TPA: DEAD/DEAH box helicase family protein [Syntrophorhabdaceae bacterium]|nr:DEAD/DEAH box helicase family protein [Syntrophorhabdaceae bacterium]